MDIIFPNVRIRDFLNSSKKLVKRYGKRQAEVVRRRMDDLRAASVMEDFRNLPGRCHELRGNRKGQLSLDLKHPFRLVFEPADNPVPQKDDGGLDWIKVTTVRIIGIEDTHE